MQQYIVGHFQNYGKNEKKWMLGAKEESKLNRKNCTNF